MSGSTYNYSGSEEAAAAAASVTSISTTNTCATIPTVGGGIADQDNYTTRVLNVQHQTSDSSFLQCRQQSASNKRPMMKKKKRNQPGNPDPEAEIIALSPTSLLSTTRFICEICNKGFQRDQNLQLHRRGHNLPWKLKQHNKQQDMVIKRKAYVCPEPSCVHHHPSRALGDLTGVKKHYSRKHGEKKYGCDKCGKVYAVKSDWKAHVKGCGTKEYRCDCGTLFSRKDSFITHRAFCDALAEESARVLISAATSNPFVMVNNNTTSTNPQPTSIVDSPPLFPSFSTQLPPPQQSFPNKQWQDPPYQLHHQNRTYIRNSSTNDVIHLTSSSNLPQPPAPFTSSSSSSDYITRQAMSLAHHHTPTSSTHLSATTHLQKACTIGVPRAHQEPCQTTVSTFQSNQEVVESYMTSANPTKDDDDDDNKVDNGMDPAVFNGPMSNNQVVMRPPVPVAGPSSLLLDDQQHYLLGLMMMRSTEPHLEEQQRLSNTWTTKTDHLTRDFLGLTGHSSIVAAEGADASSSTPFVNINTDHVATAASIDEYLMMPSSKRQQQQQFGGSAD